jgi:hypothetical protein
MRFLGKSRRSVRVAALKQNVGDLLFIDASFSSGTKVRPILGVPVDARNPHSVRLRRR